MSGYMCIRLRGEGAGPQGRMGSSFTKYRFQNCVCNQNLIYKKNHQGVFFFFLIHIFQAYTRPSESGSSGLGTRTLHFFKDISGDFDVERPTSIRRPAFSEIRHKILFFPALIN